MDVMAVPIFCIVINAVALSVYFFVVPPPLRAANHVLVLVFVGAVGLTLAGFVLTQPRRVLLMAASVFSLAMFFGIHTFIAHA